MNALVFQNTTFNIIDRDNQPWLRVHQIGEALGYKNPDRSLTNLYNANSDEFTDTMTALVELDTEGGKQQVRIFSLRGCHLLGMLSKTKIAKDFRVWVLDVLDHNKDTSTPPAQPSLTLADIERLIDSKLNAQPPRQKYVRQEGIVRVVADFKEETLAEMMQQQGYRLTRI